MLAVLLLNILLAPYEIVARGSGYFRAYCFRNQADTENPWSPRPGALMHLHFPLFLLLFGTFEIELLLRILDIRIATWPGASIIHSISSAHAEHLCGYSLFLKIEMEFTHHKIHLFKVCNSLGFGIFTVLCNYHHYLIPEHVHHPLKTPSPLAVIWSLPTAPTIGNH